MKLDPSILYKECVLVTFENSLQNLRLAQQLVQLMFREQGIGLAANQVGINLRLFVMYVEHEIFHCFNPAVLSASDEIISSLEGCLSFPGQKCLISRHKTICTEFADSRGHRQVREFTGLAARCFQHELDHLNGITMHQRGNLQDESSTSTYLSFGKDQ